MLKGSIVALVTPMKANGSIDNKAIAQLIEWHIASRTDGIVVTGTTGESATLDTEEQSHLISFTVKEVAGRLPVIAGTGSNSTRAALQLTENARKAGADACLVVTPYYNKPTQEGLYQHFKIIAEKGDLPLLLYNVPTRTGCDLLPETVVRLSKIENIIGIKEATGKLERALEIQNQTEKTFKLYSGDDATALNLLLQGAEGVISVTANVAPLKMHELCQAVIEKNITLAQKLNEELNLLHHRLFLESNPIPVKWALHHMGKIAEGIRLPLLPLDHRYHAEVKEALEFAGVK